MRNKKYFMAFIKIKNYYLDDQGLRNNSQKI